MVQSIIRWQWYKNQAELQALVFFGHTLWLYDADLFQTRVLHLNLSRWIHQWVICILGSSRASWWGVQSTNVARQQTQFHPSEQDFGWCLTATRVRSKSSNELIRSRCWQKLSSFLHNNSNNSKVYKWLLQEDFLLNEENSDTKLPIHESINENILRLVQVIECSKVNKNTGNY